MPMSCHCARCRKVVTVSLKERCPSCDADLSVGALFSAAAARARHTEASPAPFPRRDPPARPSPPQPANFDPFQFLRAPGDPTDPDNDWRPLVCMLGGALGTFFFPCVGTVVGAYAGWMVTDGLQAEARRVARDAKVGGATPSVSRDPAAVHTAPRPAPAPAARPSAPWGPPAPGSGDGEYEPDLDFSEQEDDDDDAKQERWFDAIQKRRDWEEWADDHDFTGSYEEYGDTTGPSLNDDDD
jgi:hypothetical protein